MGRTRRVAFRNVAAIAVSLILGPQSVQALSVPSGDALSKQAIPQPQAVIGTTDSTTPTVAYRSLSLDIAEYGVSVPVAMWYPTGDMNQEDGGNMAGASTNNLRVLQPGDRL